MTHAFAATLKRLRESAGFSQSKLADRAGCDHSFVSRLESDDRVPTRDTVYALSSALELSRAGRAAFLQTAGFSGGAEDLPLDAWEVDPDLRDLATVFGDEELPAEFRQGLRTQVRGLIESARFVQKLEAA